MLEESEIPTAGAGRGGENQYLVSAVPIKPVPVSGSKGP